MIRVIIYQGIDMVVQGQALVQTFSQDPAKSNNNDMVCLCSEKQQTHVAPF